MVVKAEKSLRLEWWDSAELAENPKNWRRHPPAQAAAMREILAEVGWAGAALYNQRTGHMIDGHLRKKVVKKGEKVPVLVGSWSDEQEAKILLTLDPLGAMAEADVDRLEALLKTVHTDNPAISELLARIGDQYLPPQSLTEVVDPAPQIERAAELLRKWDTERGQLWRIGPIGSAPGH